MQVHVVQYVHGGVPEDPLIFTDEAQAELKYIDLINKEHGKSFTSFSEAGIFVLEHCEDCDNDVRIWGLIDIIEP